MVAMVNKMFNINNLLFKMSDDCWFLFIDAVKSLIELFVLPDKESIEFDSPTTLPSKTSELRKTIAAICLEKKLGSARFESAIAFKISSLLSVVKSGIKYVTFHIRKYQFTTVRVAPACLSDHLCCEVSNSIFNI